MDSEGADVALQTKNNEPWQCCLDDPGARLLSIYKNGSFTDITLTFPGTNITYDAYRLILAITSPVFEGILYGPMRTDGRNIELHGDDPFVMKHIIAYCYGVEPELFDLNVALQVYKLADKYFINDLKQHCCAIIGGHLDKDNIKEFIEFTKGFDYTDWKSYFLPHLIDRFEEEIIWSKDESDNIFISSILMELSDDWIHKLLTAVDIKELDFCESWKYPESPLPYNRLSTIICASSYLSKFSGCMNAENLHQISDYVEWDLCLSITGPNHAKKVIETINQQNQFEKHLIAIHIRCGEVWPRNWSPIPPERTHRPSILLLSDVDDEKVSWVIEAVKALLPQTEGSYSKVFPRVCKYSDYGMKVKLRPINILKLPRSNLTIKGFTAILQGISTSALIFTKIILQSTYISSADQVVFEDFEQYGQLIKCLPMDNNFFEKVFEDFPKI